AALAFMKRRREIDLDETPAPPAHFRARLAIRRDQRADGRHALLFEPAGPVADAVDVRITLVTREPEAREQIADGVAVEALRRQIAANHFLVKREGDGGFPGTGQTREPDDGGCVWGSLRLHDRGSGHRAG